MTKNKHLKASIILLPPIILVVIGIVIYALVSKLIEPDVKTISIIPTHNEATPSSSTSTVESSPSAKMVNPITTTIKKPSESELRQWQSEVDDGKDEWRKDPVSAAEHLAGNYGFTPGDQLNLVTSQDSTNVSGTASILAIHGGEAFIITMNQPVKTGADGIWVIQSIEKQ